MPFSKKYLLAIPVLILAVLFWAPWMAEDGGEDTMRKIVTQKKITVAQADIRGMPVCEGLSSAWAPFGRKVQYCDLQSWYVPFWGSVYSLK